MTRRISLPGTCCSFRSSRTPKPILSCYATLSTATRHKSNDTQMVRYDIQEEVQSGWIRVSDGTCKGGASFSSLSPPAPTVGGGDLEGPASRDCCRDCPVPYFRGPGPAANPCLRWQPSTSASTSSNLTAYQNPLKTISVALMAMILTMA